MITLEQFASLDSEKLDNYLEYVSHQTKFDGFGRSVIFTWSGWVYPLEIDGHKILIANNYHTDHGTVWDAENPSDYQFIVLTE